ncbi:MAG: hypothetical protein GKS06_15235 [Acidobacteria bacterium]|nr:hypothetical protein [Acidobacteriota bacterium]
MHVKNSGNKLSACINERSTRSFAYVVAISLLLALAAVGGHWAEAQEPEVREVVLIGTNDFESAIEPLPAFWLEGSPLMGGAAHIKTMVDEIREREGARGNPVFLFDSGDMFTGLLSRLTYGEILMEMMITMGYDAMGMGNHEFDYGAANFLKQANRVPFPVLSCNTYYRGTDILYMQPHAVLERSGVRLGVIGVIGRDAISVVVPSLVADLEFRDPVECVRESVEELRDDVDIVVVLAHQGKTGPMQSDQENDPSVWRDFEEDIALTSAVPGIDVFFGGHAHRGIDPPYVNPDTGTIIVQTFGHGTRLAMLRLKVDTAGGRVLEHEGGLVTPWTADYEPDAIMQLKMDAYSAEYAAEIARPVGDFTARLTRKYNVESDLGNFVADVIREIGDAEVGLTNAGGLRADLPSGPVAEGHVRDALPFLNHVVVVEMTGTQLLEVLEQGVGLERGMIQVSGLTVDYDPSAPVGDRLIAVTVGDAPVASERRYRVATNSFVAEGGDLYTTFDDLEWVDEIELSLADAVFECLGRHTGRIALPQRGRLNRQEKPQ